MIKTLKVTNNTGEVINIELRSPEESGLFVQNIEGLGPPKSIINVSESLYGDGGFFNSARLSQRNIIIDLGFYNDGSQTIEEIRNSTYRFFPIKREIQLEIETDLRTGVIKGYVESNEPKIFSNGESTLISILCPKPYFFEKEPVKTTFSGSTPNFEFPWENPSLTESLIEFGYVFINDEANVFYIGDIPTGVIIFINFLGPVNDLVIHNTITGESLAINSAKLIALTGSDFISGDLVILSTVQGDKYIRLYRNSNTINILNAIDFPADWFQIDRGDNVFSYTVDSGLSNVVFFIQHQIVYGGL
jgi:hypothetical protein